MIEEDYVSFEVAKLLKEKGFDVECDYLYVNGEILRAQGFKCNWNKGESIFTDYKNECSAPTLQMAMKWLRKTYNYVINVNYIDFLEFGEVWSYTIIDKSTFAEYYKDTENSYELAAEVAIKYCLENLI